MEKASENVCYQHIKDQYYYSFVEDLKLILDENTGYFNATLLCQQTGKKWIDWFKNKKSKELIDYFDQESMKSFTKVHRKDDKIISGIYCRKELLLSLALWMSPECYEKVYKIILFHSIYDFYRKKEEKMDTTELQTNKHPKRLHIFTLIKLDVEPTSLPYYAMRTYKSNYSTNLKRIQAMFPRATIVYEWKYNIHAFNLLNRIKEEIENVDVSYNKIRLLNHYTEEEFIKDVTNLVQD